MNVNTIFLIIKNLKYWGGLIGRFTSAGGSQVDCGLRFGNLSDEGITSAFRYSMSQYDTQKNLKLHVVYIFLASLHPKFENCTLWLYLLLSLSMWTKHGLVGFYYDHRIEIYINVYIILCTGKYFSKKPLGITYISKNIKTVQLLIYMPIHKSLQRAFEEFSNKII